MNPQGRILFREVDYTIRERTPPRTWPKNGHEPLREELARQTVACRFARIRPHAAGTRKGLNRELTGGRLRGTVRQLSLEDLAVQTASLSVRFKTEGTLRYDARPTSPRHERD